MTPLDDTHKGLLLALARNTNDGPAKMAYADYLMEINNPGHIIVLNYRIHEWPVWVPGANWGWRLPWLEGKTEYKQISHHLRRIKWILTQYAEGRVK